MALAALRAYVAFIKEDFDRADRYGMEERRAFLIARVLFDPPPGDPTALAASNTFPYALFGGLRRLQPPCRSFPFSFRTGFQFACQCGTRRQWYGASMGTWTISWNFSSCAHRTESMRTEALVPTINPIEAVERNSRRPALEGARQLRPAPGQSADAPARSGAPRGFSAHDDLEKRRLVTPRKGVRRNLRSHLVPLSARPASVMADQVGSGWSNVVYHRAMMPRIGATQIPDVRNPESEA